MGASSEDMVHQAGKVLFVVLGAALTEEIPASDPNVRIIRGAVNALSDQAEVEEISPAHRTAICSGLDASVRMLEDLPYKAVVDAACDLELKLRNSAYVGTQDFLTLIAKLGAPNP